MQHNLSDIAKLFIKTSESPCVELINSGNINNTYLVLSNDEFNRQKFILQEISPIFNDPKNLILNYKNITEYLEVRLQNKSIIDNLGDRIRWEVPRLIKTVNSHKDFVQLGHAFWRAMSYIDKSKNVDSILKIDDPKEVGYGLGLFHFLMSGFDLNKLSISIENFHNTPLYLSQYKSTVSSSTWSGNILPREMTRLSKINKFVDSKITYIDHLYNSINSKLISKYIIHGDPKISNYMFDNTTDRVISLIDLDTVQPGHICCDIADCLRSCCNVLGEDTKDVQNIIFDLDIFKLIIEGYLISYGSSIPSKELKLIPEFTYLIIFELGIRFLTDFLNQSKYFKIEYPLQNLYRSEVQFALLKSLDSQWQSLLQILDELC